MDARFCDELPFAFSWLVEEPMTRTAHALVADHRVWLVDPIEWEPALERIEELGTAAAVVQLLDRHKRDCASLAARLGIPHLVTPASVPDAPFLSIAVRNSRYWRETALWWAAMRTLVVAEALGTNEFFRTAGEPLGVHLLLRVTPPRVLGQFKPEHLLLGHGEGIHGAEATTALRNALETSRHRLPSALLRAPAFAVDALRRRR